MMNENEIQNRVVQLCIDMKRANEQNFYSKITDCVKREFDCDYTAEQIRGISRKYRNLNNLDENFNSKDGVCEDFGYCVTIEKDGTQTSEKKFSLKQGESITPELLLEKHGFDKNKFEIISAKNSKWNMQKKGANVVDLYSSKISVKPIKDFIWNAENIEEIFKNIKITKEAPYRKKYDVDRCERMLVVPISDLHLGLLSEKKTTGNDYNMEIAEDLYYYVLNDVVKEFKNQSIDKVMFILGNDFLNHDNIMATTTKGTPQDASNQWHSIIDKATEICINGINMLSDAFKKPVDVVYAVSNHDYHSMYGIMNTLKAHYRKDENITIIGEPSERKYIQFGENIIGIAHDIKIEKALELMSVEAHSMWSDCKSMVWFLGHLHTQMAYSKKGYVEVFRLPTVSGWSRWSNQQGYTQTERRNQAFIIDAKTGIKNTLNTVIKL